MDGFGIMAVAAGVIAALQEDRSSVSGPIHDAGVDDSVDKRFQSRLRTFLSRMRLLRTSPSPQVALAC